MFTVKNRNILYIVVVIGVLLLLDGVFNIDYFTKQGIRIIVMLVIPLLLYIFVDKKEIKKEFGFLQNASVSMWVPVSIGLVIVLVTVFGYFLLQGMFDSSEILSGLQEIGIDKSNIIFVGIYMSFGNSLLEEFFFRGFVEDNVKSKRMGMLISSSLFALYHVFLMTLMFPFYLVILAFLGLFIVGYVLSYINQYGRGFLYSYILHIFADIGVVLVGLYMVFI